MTLTLDRIFVAVAVTLCICHICPPYETHNGVLEVKCQCFLSEEGRRPEGTEQNSVAKGRQWLEDAGLLSCSSLCLK